MISFEYTITDEMGIHARPAGLLVKKAQKYESSIISAIGTKIASCNKIFSIMGLAAKFGDILHITVDGSDEDIAAAGMQAFLKQNL